MQFKLLTQSGRTTHCEAFFPTEGFGWIWLANGSNGGARAFGVFSFQVRSRAGVLFSNRECSIRDGVGEAV